jgi:hypothetical protein
VGTWTQTGGGAAEWMRQNMKMAQVSAVAGNGTLTLQRRWHVFDLKGRYQGRGHG